MVLNLKRNVSNFMWFFYKKNVIKSSLLKFHSQQKFICYNIRLLKWSKNNF